MNSSDGLVKHRNQLLFGTGESTQLSFLDEKKEREVDISLHFCPVPKEELAPYLIEGASLRTDDPEYTRLNLIKRTHLHEVYNCLATLMFAIVNVDAINDMRKSVSVLKSKLGNDAVVQGLEQVLSHAETYIDRLTTYPTDGEACKAISDLSQQYNSIVEERVIPLSKGFSTKLSSREIADLTIKYGVTRDYTVFDTYEKIVDYMRSAGFGFSHFIWSREGGEEKETEFAADSLKMHLTTRGDVLFHMSCRPNSDQEIRDVYGIKGSTHHVPPGPLQPIYVWISTRGKETVHAERLERLLERVTTMFQTARTDKGTTLAYCPHPKCMGYTEQDSPAALQLG